MLIDDVLFPGTADRISRAFKPRESATRFGCGKSYVQPPIVVEVGNGHTRPVGPSLVKPMLRPRIVQRVFGVLQPPSPFHNVWLSVPVEIGDARSLSIGFRHDDRSPGIRAVLEKDNVFGLIDRPGKFPFLIGDYDVDLSVATEVGDFQVMRRFKPESCEATDDVNFPGICGRIPARPRVLVSSHLFASVFWHNDVQVSIAIAIDKLQVIGEPSGGIDDMLGPGRVLIPVESSASRSTPGTNNIHKTIAVDIANTRGLLVDRSMGVANNVLERDGPR